MRERGEGQLSEQVDREDAARREAAGEGPFHDVALSREQERAGVADADRRGASDGVVAEGMPAAGAPVAEVVTATMTQRQLAWRRFKRHKLAVASAIVLIVIALLAIFAPLFTKYSFEEQDLTSTLQGPSWSHFFGTDTLGRDQFTRVMYGGRVSLAVGIAVALSATVIGTVIGAVAGYYGGKADNLLMRVTDLFLSIPFLVVLILGSLLLGGRIIDIVIVLSLFFWMPDARIVRGIFLSLKEKEFVEAARASGASNRRIIFNEMLPNAMGPIIVATTLSVAAAILTESVLSFLGFGIQPPTPTWGNLLDAAKNLSVSAPWLLIFPGVAILITVLCVNFLGDGLRDALDPQQQGTRI
jgi:peptide/nickel transport system permease protein